MLDPRARKVDWTNLQRHDPDRKYDLSGTKRKYGMAEHMRYAPVRRPRHTPAPPCPCTPPHAHSPTLTTRPFRRMHDVKTWWNTGASLDPDSPIVREWLGAVAKRARHDATAQRSSIASHFKGKQIEAPQLQ